MNTTLSRRTLLHHAALGSAALVGAAILPHTGTASAQDLAKYVCEYYDVNLRDNYGLDSNVIGQVNYGDVVYFEAGPIDADGYTWRAVTVLSSGASGWAVEDFFSRAGNEYGWQPGTTVHVTSDNLNMREGVGLDKAIITTFDTGATGTITAGPFPSDGYTWYELTIDGTAGCVVDAFLAEGAGNGGGGGGPIGSTMHVDTDGLNLRTDPALNARVIMTLTYGTTVTISDGPVSADGYTWYEVTFPGSAGYGWVAGEFLAEGAGGTEPTGDRLRVIDGPLNWRYGPSLDSEVIMALETGTVVVIADASFVEADGYTWMRVYLESEPAVSGWIAQGFTEGA